MHDQLDAAAPYFETFAKISKQLFRQEKHNPRYQSELLSATSTWLALEIQRDASSTSARTRMQETQALIKDIAEQPKTVDTIIALANASDWVGEYFEKRGDELNYFDAVYQGQTLLQQAYSLDPSNLEVAELLLNSEFTLGLIIQDPIAKNEQLQKALARVQKMRLIDDANVEWQEYEQRLLQTLEK